MRAALICSVMLSIGVLAARSARADDTPWAAGVSAQNQKAALDLYNQGETAYREGEYRDALLTYTRALALWDHPAIRYNIAVCLINLDRPVEALDNLERAMRFGAAPLDPGVWREAQLNRKLLAAQLAEIEVQSQPGAAVSLDGKPLEGASRRVLTGDHQIVVEMPSYQTETRAIRLDPGEHVTVKIELKPIAVARTLHRRWNRWLPWSVLGGGVVVTAIGAPVLLAASSSVDTYDAAVTTDCPHGCITGTPAAQRVMNLQSHADAQKTAAYGLFIAGGAIAATGFVMVILNQPHLVTPIVTPDRVGLALQGRF